MIVPKKRRHHQLKLGPSPCTACKGGKNLAALAHFSLAGVGGVAVFQLFFRETAGRKTEKVKFWNGQV